MLAFQFKLIVSRRRLQYLQGYELASLQYLQGYELATFLEKEHSLSLPYFIGSARDLFSSAIS
jgi:hypothetical protein